MKKNTCFLALILTSLQLFAGDPQDTVVNWKIGGDASLTFSQVSFENWSAGGQNSVAGTFIFNTFVNYTRDRHEWENILQIGYGLTQQGGENLIKSEDRFLIASKYGYKAAGDWYYSGIVDFRTQMTTGYQNPPENSVVLSELMSPGYLLTSIGMDYKPGDNFSLYMSPLTSKITFVLDDSLANAGAFGVDPGENVRGEYGASVKTTYKKSNIISNVDFFTRLDLFSNYIEKPQNIDVEWEARLNMKVNEWLSAQFSVNLLYDDDIKYVDSEGIEHGPRVQTKQLLGFGLTYRF